MHRMCKRVQHKNTQNFNPNLPYLRFSLEVTSVFTFQRISVQNDDLLDVTERQGVTGTIGLAGAALAVGVLTVALGQAIEEENNRKSDPTYAVSCTGTYNGGSIPSADGQVLTCTFTDTNNNKNMVIVSGSGTSPQRYTEGTVLLVELIRTYLDDTGATLTEQARKTVTVGTEDLNVDLNIVVSTDQIPHVYHILPQG